MASVLDGVAVKVQPRSGFDKSRKNILTSKVGTLTPILNDLLIPNSDFYIKMAISASLPPLASETFMRCSLKVEAFAVPMRLLYGGFESWLTGSELYNSSGTAFRAQLPRVKIGSPSSNLFGPGTLLDYLGFQIDNDTFSSASAQNQYVYCNIFPLLAYHLIYDSWYRNTRVSKPVFNRPGTTLIPNATPTGSKLSMIPYLGYDTIMDFTLGMQFSDGAYLGGLRQRNYGTDYFTACTPDTQIGAPMTVTTNSSGQFSISALREANSIQQWEELQNLTGARIQDYVRANYGAHLSSGVAQRPVLLGSADYPVYSQGVYANQGVTATNNPFTSVGARYGSAYASGTDFIVKASVDEPCILMVLVSLVPEANYSRLASAFMQRFTQLGSLMDMPNPMLQNIGNEAVMQSELSVDVDFSDTSAIFGYLPRYSWHKTAINEVHGLLQAGQSLSSFVAKRSFSGYGTGAPQISSNFLQINTSDLDSVTAVSSQLSSYGVWIDSYIQYFVSMPLAKYSIPSLQNPAYEHGKTEYLQRGGSKL